MYGADSRQCRLAAAACLRQRGAAYRRVDRGVAGVVRQATGSNDASAARARSICEPERSSPDVDPDDLRKRRLLEEGLRPPALPAARRIGVRAAVLPTPIITARKVDSRSASHI